ncbi:hypothetical protein ACTVZO_17600 [Streptomyces sp. IBSNAI002]|uniref:hypothetical protein n=1 Tax=Streptomyces sp. IBSNAI002 TaxID=3457500 RepID=UPI003FD1D23F
MNDPNAPRTASTAPAVVALLSLLGRAEKDPACELLITDVAWSVSPHGVAIGGSYWPLVDPDENAAASLLQATRALLGGTLSDAGERCDADHTWYTLRTHVAGIPVQLRAAVPTVTVERELRTRIAELEARAAGQALSQ